MFLSAHLQELVNAGKFNRESVDLLLNLENQLHDVLMSFCLRIMNSHDEFSTATFLLRIYPRCLLSSHCPVFLWH